ncbi:N-acetylmuramoyl-L-alanine amidase family protein [Clostridium beijerinckii]|uniref:N-acetylmuramoyl-L-alanine amidase family protein n=1 Tax=Clostridium beijerinckii TaxID=1520 RepID=A0A7X9SMM0_CLOBE|nr:N-acetylmuramoyl-L-alanine amidase family protein [Clostridium beijerinckii]NMF04702.1 N-acetylmuramoyl-L-alanine amidase family protein [Clostridium beijerinckii]
MKSKHLNGLAVFTAATIVGGSVTGINAYASDLSLTTGGITSTEPTVTGSPSPDETLNTYKTQVSNIIDSITLTNSTSHDDICSAIENRASFGISNININIEIGPATSEMEGYLTVIGTIDTSDGYTIDVNKNLPIPKLTIATQSQADLSAAVRSYIASRTPSNNDNVDTIKNELTPLIKNSDFRIMTTDFVQTKATEQSEGSESFYVLLYDDVHMPNGSYDFIEYTNIAIPKLQAQTGFSRLCDKIKEELPYYYTPNDTTEEYLKPGVERLIEYFRIFYPVPDQVINASISNLVVNKSTTEAEGLATFTVTMTNETTGEVKAFDTSMSIFKLERPVPNTNNILPNIVTYECQHLPSKTMTNDTDETELIADASALANEYLGNNNEFPLSRLGIKIQNFNKKKATTIERGYVEFHLLLNDKNVSSASTDLYFKLAIEKLDGSNIPVDGSTPPADGSNTPVAGNTPPTTGTSNGAENEIDTELAVAKAKVADYLSSLTATNSLTSDNLKSTLTTKVNNSNIGIEVTTFNKVESTNSITGSIDIKITLSKRDQKVTVNSNKVIAKNSSNSSSSSNSSKGSKSNNSIPKAIDAANQEHKEGIVSSISKDGSIVSTPKEVLTKDGNRLVVSSINKSNVYTGTVLTSDNASSGSTVTIPSNAKIDAVYKYVPLLDKYIQINNGITVATGVVTLPTEANATYFISTNSLAPSETVNAGWVNHGDSWYVIDANGNTKTGWYRDNNGWSYLNTSTGVMKTGWMQDAGNWYHIKDNGYMSTGWVQDGNNWYYLNQDGSMAHDTVVDGYTVGSNGAWIG